MKEYRIEVVRRASGRFGWSFVRIDDRGRRVLARSSRSYRTRKRVRRAIAALEQAIVVDATRDFVPFSLPATSFRLVPGVVPLIVEESPLEDDDTVYEVRGASARDDDDREAAAIAREEEVAAREAELAEQEEEAAAQEQRSGRIRRKAT